MEKIEEIIENAEGSDGTFNDFMEGITTQLQQLVKESSIAPQTAWEHWSSFSAAVNWNETWIRGLIAFHIFMLLAVIITRKNSDVQSVLFIFLGLVVYFSERLNTYCSEHWKEFATQDYFDKSGIFTGLMLSFPIILILLYQLVNFLFLTSSALISVKRAELKRKIKSDKNNDSSATATATTDSGPDDKKGK